MEDAELIQRVRSGDREAYGDLVRQYQAKVIRLCTSLLSDGTLAQNAAQNVFLKAYRGLDGFRAESAFSTWLYRITANHCKDLLRKRERTESWDALLEAHVEKIHHLLLANAKNGHHNGEDAQLVHKILSRLPAGCRIVLTLREMQGLSYRELADTLHCSVDAIKSRLRRARHVLSNRLRHFTLAENVESVGRRRQWNWKNGS